MTRHMSPKEASGILERIRAEASKRSSGEQDWPPGWSELNGRFDLLEAPTTPLYIPGEHAPLRSLRDINDWPELLELQDDDPNPRAPVVSRDEGNIDLLAWYSTFRKSGRWGIFIREAGIERLVEAVTRRGQRAGPDERRIGLTTLYLHEYAHFLFDIAALALEDLVSAPLYEPHRASIQRSGPGWDPTTEAVCNAFAYRTVRATGAKRRLAAFLRRAPIGYRDYGHYLSDPDFGNGVELVLGSLLRGPGGRPGQGLRGLFLDRPDVSIGPWLVPVHIVPELHTAPLFAIIKALGELDTSTKFDRELRKLPDPVRRAWQDQVVPSLKTDVRQANQFKRLKGETSHWSVRVAGTYRVIIEQQGGDRWTAIGVDHRRDVYKKR